MKFYIFSQSRVPAGHFFQQYGRSYTEVGSLDDRAVAPSGTCVSRPLLTIGCHRHVRSPCHIQYSVRSRGNMVFIRPITVKHASARESHDTSHGHEMSHSI